MALRGIKVLEFVGLAPGPFCGQILADFGATVTRIDKSYSNPQIDTLRRGKQTLAVNLKNKRGQQLVRSLAGQYDVVLEPFRPGVMEKLNLGPEILCKDNPRLVYARLTGFGQTGPLAPRAGHDINYAAYSGVLSMLRLRGGPPTPPMNLLADFCGGSVMCALGICIALLERVRSGRGQVLDAAMMDGAAYMASWLFSSRNLHFWDAKLFEGGCYFYDVYETKDNKFMSCGPIEPQFLEIFKKHLGLDEDLPQFVSDEKERERIREIVVKKFKEKTQEEWMSIFNHVDACVFPVVEWRDVMNHEHHKERKSFEVMDGVLHPKPAPRLSRTPGELKWTPQNPMEEAVTILKDLKIGGKEIKKLVDDGVIELPIANSKL